MSPNANLNYKQLISQKNTDYKNAYSNFNLNFIIQIEVTFFFLICDKF